MSQKLLYTLLLAVPALADVHYLYSGFFSGSTLAGIQFDDETSSLKLVSNFSANAASGSKWIALDSRLKNLYVATTGYIQSYSIGSNNQLTYETNVSLSSDCSNGNFILVSSEPPYAVFATPYSSGCGSLAISVDSNGVLNTTFATAEYDNSTGVHGTALVGSSNNSNSTTKRTTNSTGASFLYSADDMGNGVWVHSYDTAGGTVNEVQHLTASEDSNPRHVAVHPSSGWAYVVYEEANEIAAYERDTVTGKLNFKNQTYSLLPSGFTNSSSYWADEVVLSKPKDKNSTPKYLLAATRSRETDATGYVSAFSLDAETGAIVKQLFLVPTTGSGGSANAVSAASFSEQFFAITDSASNFIEVWEISSSGGNATTASAVARLDLSTGPANAVWYS